MAEQQRRRTVNPLDYVFRKCNSYRAHQFIMDKHKIKQLNEEYTQFKKACLFWIDKLGLKDWDIVIEQGMPGEHGYSYADTNSNLEQKFARITFYGSLVYSSRAELYALHEILHILLEPCGGEKNFRY